MENWKKDARRDVAITDIEALVPKDHLLRKIEKIMDYELECYHLSRVGKHSPLLMVTVLVTDEKERDPRFLAKCERRVTLWQNTNQKSHFLGPATHSSTLVRMRSAVRICPAAPLKAVAPSGAAAFFAPPRIRTADPCAKRTVSERSERICDECRSRSDRHSAVRICPAAPKKRLPRQGRPLFSRRLVYFELPTRARSAR